MSGIAPRRADRLDRWPASVLAVLRRLREARVETYVVGGAVRDALLERPLRDVDLLVPEGLERAHAALPELIAIDAAQPVLALPARGRRPRIELCGLRGDARSVEQDLQARDFTLNAIAYDPIGGGFIDPLGGRSDLAERLLRAADPERGFRDDPVRILRGARLEVELELRVEEATLRAMERASVLLVGAAGERLREELFRLLALDDPVAGIERLRRVGALASLLPELLRGVGIAQNRLHSDDVYRHSLRVCRLAAPVPLLRLAALLHDVAKPDTKQFAASSSDFRFLRHEHEAAPHLDRVAERLRLSRREHQTLVRLVRHHLIFPERLQSDGSVRRLIRRSGRSLLGDLLELRRADLAARLPDGRGSAPGTSSLSEWDAFAARVQEVAARSQTEGALRLAIGGRVIMKELGIPEGPEVGRWLQRARRRVLERPEENERMRLLAWLRAAHEAEG